MATWFIRMFLHRPVKGRTGDSILQGYGNGKYQNSIPVYTSFEMPRM